MAPPEEGNLNVRCQQHQDGVLRYLGQLLTSQAFADVTICCQNRRLKAHRILLSACSHYLQRVLLAHLDPDHITLILHDIDYCDMKLLLDFMYTGAVSVSREGLARFLQAAETLQVRVLNRHSLAKTDCDNNTVTVRPDCDINLGTVRPDAKADCDINPVITKKWPATNWTTLDLDLRLKIPASSAEGVVTATRTVLKQQQLSSIRRGPPRVTASTFQGHEGSSYIFEHADKYVCTKRGMCCDKDSYAQLENKYEIPARDQHMFLSARHSVVENRTTPHQPQAFTDKQGVNGSATYPHGHITEHPLVTLCKEHQRFGHQRLPAWARPLPCLMPITTGVPEPPYLQLREAAHDLTPTSDYQTKSIVSQQGDANIKSVPKVPRLTPILPPSPWVQHNRAPCVAPRVRDSGPVRHWNPGLPQEDTDDPSPGGTKRCSDAPPLLCRLKERRLQEFYRDQRNATVSPDEASDLSVKGGKLYEPVAAAPQEPSTALESARDEEPQPPDAPVEKFRFPKPSQAEQSDAETPEDRAGTDEVTCDRNNNADHGCEDCGKCFSRRQLLVQHRRIHTGERPYRCGDCGKQFTQRGHWSSHQKLHGPARRPEHACPNCGKGFVTRASLKVHVRTHTGEKPFQCTECGKQFSQLRNYKYHRSVHEGTREFAATCPECGKYFNDRGYLSSHMKIHRNRKEYACQYCGKSFNQRVAYNMHVRIHTGERPHSCQHCGKSFSRKMLLKQHLRIHTGEKPFACEVCGKAFADRSNMTLHMRLHSGIKPYTCNTCSKAFTKKHHLKTHMNYHTGVKPYACDKCALRFSQSSNMRTHYKKCSANSSTSPVGSTFTPTSSTTSPANDVTRIITPPHSDESSCASSVNTNQTDK